MMKRNDTAADLKIPTLFNDLPPWGWHTVKVTVDDTYLEVHSVPLGDYRQHAYDQRCWCCPVEPPADIDCHDLFIHNALDGRTWYDTHHKH